MEVYTRVRTGELQGSATALQLPDIPCRMVWFKAEAANAGNVYLGFSSAETVVDGTTDVTTGIQLDAGDLIGPIPVMNLNYFYRICDNAGDDLTYICVG